MTQPPPPPTAPDPDRIEIDGGEPNGYVVVALDRDVDPDPARDLADVLAAGVVAPAPDRLLALLAALGDPPTRRLVSPRARDAVQRLRERGRRGRVDPRARSHPVLADRPAGRARRPAGGRPPPPGRARRGPGLRRVAGGVGAHDHGADGPDHTDGPDDADGPESDPDRATGPTGPTTAQRPVPSAWRCWRRATWPRPPTAWPPTRSAPAAARAARAPVRRRRGGLAAVPPGATRAHAPAMATTPPLDNRDLVGTFVGDHGTAVLGIVAATGQGVRVRGVAPRLATVLCSSHYDAATGEELHTVDAIAEAVDHHRAGRRPAAGGSTAGGGRDAPAAHRDRPCRLRRHQRRHRRGHRRGRGRRQRHARPRPVARTPRTAPCGRCAATAPATRRRSSWAAASRSGSRTATPGSPTRTGASASTATPGRVGRHRVRHRVHGGLHHRVQRDQRRLGDRRWRRGGHAGHAAGRAPGRAPGLPDDAGVPLGSHQHPAASRDRHAPHRPHAQPRRPRHADRRRRVSRAGRRADRLTPPRPITDPRDRSPRLLRVLAAPVRRCPRASPAMRHGSRRAA